MDWEQLIDTAVTELRDRQARMKHDFDLGGWERYDVDLEDGTIVFSAGARPGVIAAVDVVGSTATNTGTWLWSWENPWLPERVKARMLAVRRFGERYGFDRLTDAKWKADEHDGWQMTAIAAHVLEADGAYRAPDAKGAVFLLLRGTRQIDPPRPEHST